MFTETGTNMKKLAVVIRGQVREWDLCKSVFFNAFDLSDVETTFFFVTWEDTKASEDSLMKDFSNVKLGKLEILSDEIVESIGKKKSSNVYVEAYDRISYIRQYASMLVNEYELENDLVFDLVVDTRPDLYIAANKSCSEFLFSPDYLDFVIGSGFIQREKKQYAEISNNEEIAKLSDLLFVDDLIFCGNSLSMGVFNTEYEKNQLDTSRSMTMSPHHHTANHILDSKLIILNLAWKFFSQYDICRPGISKVHKGLDIWKVRDYSTKYYTNVEHTKNLSIVIPMCDGRALQKIGNTHIINKVVESINLPLANFIFVCSKNDENAETKKIINSLQLSKVKTIYADPKVVRDQVSAIMLSSSLLNSASQVLVVNSDQIFDYDNFGFINNIVSNQPDCQILTFKGSNPAWSYSKIDGENVVEVKEKEVISEHANAGMYYFKTATDLFSIINQLIKNRWMVNNKYYLAPAINFLISDSKKVTNYKANSVTQVGTVREVIEYLKNDTDNRLRLH